MISVEEALDKVLSFVDILEDEKKPILECLGQVLDEDVYAPFNVPAHDNSAMDGYAAQARDIRGASYHSPKNLHVIGEVAAGYMTELEVKPGTAIRIMTGAPLPAGADVVIPFEVTDEVERKRALASGAIPADVSVFCELAEDSNIRRSGEDITQGELVIERGRQLSPAEIGVLASLGKGTVSVIRRPVVAILATGDEVLDISQPLAPGKLYNSNTYSLAAQVISYGAVPRLLGIARDSFQDLAAALLRGRDCDMLITSGGVSAGDYDVVKDVLTAEGDISFWTVCMKPGKPLAFGTFSRDDGRKIPHLGLPGNPVSSMITFEMFARPAILKMMGRRNLARPRIKAVMENSIKNSDDRRIFARVAVSEREGKYFACLTGSQGSGILTSMVKASGLAIVPETTKDVRPGDIVEVMVLDWMDG